MSRFILLLPFLLLAACQTETGSDEEDCVTSGGRWARGGLLPDEICFQPTSDGGKACQKSADCTDTCMADTMTCNTVAPLFGCYSYVDDDGAVIEICVD